MNINNLQIMVPYEVIKSKYQFKIGDIIYLYDNNMLVLQGKNDELRKATLVGGNTGFVMTGDSSGFIYLNDIMDAEDCPKLNLEGIDVKTFLFKYDKTEFELINYMKVVQKGSAILLVKLEK